VIIAAITACKPLLTQVVPDFIIASEKVDLRVLHRRRGQVDRLILAEISHTNMFSKEVKTSSSS
jgi:hypothetical protein